MKVKKVKYVAGPCRFLMALAAVGLVRAQAPAPVYLSGIINDYSPSTVAGGPWEIRGEWSLDLQGGSGSASFSAALTMETSDYGISDSTQVNPAVPATRTPHSHHITVTNAAVSSDTSVCPANNPPTTGSGIVVTGPATIAANGGPAPFEAKGSSALQICLTGGSQVELSNITVVFTGAAATHFGPQAVHGTVNASVPLISSITDQTNNQSCNLAQNTNCTLNVAQNDIVEITGKGFSPSGGNTIHLTGPGGDWWLYEQDGYLFSDDSSTRITAQLACYLPAGNWTAAVLNPYASKPSPGYSLNIAASPSCQ
jgi:hypothetical protein